MESFRCHPPVPRDAGEPKSHMAHAVSSITVLDSPFLGWLLFITVSVVSQRLWKAKASLRALEVEMQTKCTEQEQMRRQRAVLVAGNIRERKARSQEWETQLEEAQSKLTEAELQIGEADMRVAQLQSQVDTLLQEKAEMSSSRDEQSAALRNRLLSLSYSRAECLRSEEAAKDARAENSRIEELAKTTHAEKVAAIADLTRERHKHEQQLADERRISEELRAEVLKLRGLLDDAQIELARVTAEAKAAIKPPEKAPETPPPNTMRCGQSSPEAAPEAAPSSSSKHAGLDVSDVFRLLSTSECLRAQRQTALVPEDASVSRDATRSSLARFDNAVQTVLEAAAGSGELAKLRVRTSLEELVRDTELAAVERCELRRKRTAQEHQERNSKFQRCRVVAALMSAKKSAFEGQGRAARAP